MPTGPLHTRWLLDDDGQQTGDCEPCRCTRGYDHDSNGYSDEVDYFDDDSGESLNVDDAADIWLSRGMDEDYTFGYTEQELREAKGMN